jgi:hypothetical protein
MATATRRTAPVVLVHGYGGYRSRWWPLELELELRQASSTNIRTVADNPVTTTVTGILGILRALAFLGSVRQLHLDAQGPGAPAPLAV